MYEFLNRGACGILPRFAAAWAALAVVAVGCGGGGSQTAIDLTVESDDSLMLDTVDITMRAIGKDARIVSRPAAHTVLVRIVTDGLGSGATVNLDVTGVKSKAPVVEARTQATIVQGKIVKATVRLTQSCAGILSCKDTESCVDGTCVAIPTQGDAGMSGTGSGGTSGPGTGGTSSGSGGASSATGGAGSGGAPNTGGMSGTGGNGTGAASGGAGSGGTSGAGTGGYAGRGSGGITGTGGVGTGGRGSGGANSGGTGTGGAGTGGRGSGGANSGGMGTGGAPAPLGTPCGAGVVCASGVCVDGVCCDAACNRSCEQCGSDGRCVATADDAQCGTIQCPADTICADYPTSLASNRCAGRGTCKTANDCPMTAAPARTFCGANENDTRLCDGSGSCSKPTLKCGGTLCESSGKDRYATSYSGCCSETAWSCVTTCGFANIAFCDEAADCALGKVCCYFQPSNPAETRCVAASECVSGTQVSATQVCNPLVANECTGGKSCGPKATTDSLPDGYYVCR